MEISITSITPTQEDIKKYLPEFLKEKYSEQSEFSEDEVKNISKEYMSWLIAKLTTIKTVTHKPIIKRKHKGRNLICVVDDYTAIDIETTGLDPTYDEIIEIGAIKYRNGVITEKFQSLVKPINEIDEFITKLTGITNKMLSVAPDIKTILPKFLNFVNCDIIVGHNVNFDINFLYDNSFRLLKYKFSNDFIDTMRLSRKLFSNLPNHKLTTLVKAFNICENTEHRASSDAMCASQCYEYIKKYAINNNIDINSLYCTHKNKLSAKDICATVTEFNTSSPIYNKTFVFTGVLEKMIRKEAMQFVVNARGFCSDRVTKKVNYLVLGNNDYCSTIKDGKSTKQKKAEKLILGGTDIEIISENVFYDMLSD